MNIRLLSIVVILMAFNTHSEAYEIIGNLPPSTYTLEVGTYTPYASVAGSKRYYLVDEASICTSPPKLLAIPTSTYSIAVGGLYKYYKSPTGTRKAYPVSFAKECAVPPVSTVDFTGITKISTNPVIGGTGDCTYIKWKVTSKNIDGTYMFKLIEVYDAAQEINGVRVCPYN